MRRARPGRETDADDDDRRFAPQLKSRLSSGADMAKENPRRSDRRGGMRP